jgi:hypothetical protein
MYAAIPGMATRSYTHKNLARGGICCRSGAAPDRDDVANTPRTDLALTHR